MTNRVSLEQTRQFLLNQQLEIAKQLMEIEKLMPKKRRTEDYRLIKQKRKKGGFVFCVKYYVDGKELPTKYSLKTNNEEEAHKRAVAWRDDFLKSYKSGKNGENRSNAFYNLLSGYYAEGSALLAETLTTIRQIDKNLIKRYNNFINDDFIDYLEREGIKKAEDLTPEKLLKFGGWLRDTKKIKAKTINNKINGAIKQALNYLHLKEKINYNPFDHIPKGLITIKAREGEVKRRRRFPVENLFDVLYYREIWILAKTFEELENPTDKHFKDRKYLLCLIAATTGLRAGEIYMLKKSSIEKIGGIYFLNITNSSADLENERVKTENAYRRVPLHNLVYRAINDYIEKMDIKGDYIFYSGNRKSLNGNLFMEAYTECGIHCGFTEEQLKENNIDFHSFRHFYRYLINKGGISNQIARYFMGHARNMNNIDDRYITIEEISNGISNKQFLKENGKKIIDIIDSHFKYAMARHIEQDDELIVNMEPRQVEITNRHKSKIKYWTYVITGYIELDEIDDDENEDDE